MLGSRAHGPCARPGRRLSLCVPRCAAAPPGLGLSGRVAPLKDGRVSALQEPRKRQRARLSTARTPAQPLTGPDLSVVVDGVLKLPNPFVIGSGPPGTNYTVR